MRELDENAVSKITRAERTKRFLIMVTALFVTVSLAVLAVVLVKVAQTQEDNKHLLSIIEDCTDPEGACAQRSQNNTGSLVSLINEITLYAATCADKTGAQDVTTIRACIAELVAASDEEK